MLDELPEHAINLGNGVYYTKVVDKDGTWLGINEWHKCQLPGKEHRWCPGLVVFDFPYPNVLSDRPRWKVISLEPLHLEPSLLCRTCGHHGWIRDGLWVAT
jgi:hypothetical protein